MIEKRQFYIEGKWVDPCEGREFQITDPSTEEHCATISLAGAVDVDDAVAAAANAFGSWAATPTAQRLDLAKRILDIYQRRSEEMGTLISLEMGAPIDMAKSSQVGAGAWHIQGFIEAFAKFEFLRRIGAGSSQTRIAYESVGVAALITPWNWPMNQVTMKVIPALLAGCTMVLKPSEIAPLSSLLFAEILDEAGTPPGVFNLVNGDGQTAGSRLCAHTDVDMISFTGSTRAGIAITTAAAPTLKKVCLELGGKGANLVFADADDEAIERSVKRCFNNSGQSCNAPTRMLVEKSSYEKVIDIARKVAETTKVASAHQTGGHIGPVVSAAQYEKIQNLIESGVEEGARLVAGGLGRPTGLNRGYFVRPTVFADVTPGMRIEKEEIFGPVLSIMPFTDESEAVEMANDTPYGLTNYIQTRNGERSQRLARALRSGMVEMNGVSLGSEAFFGGVKASGRAREGSHWGIEEFLDTKAVSGWRE